MAPLGLGPRLFSALRKRDRQESDLDEVVRGAACLAALLAIGLIFTTATNAAPLGEGWFQEQASAAAQIACDIFGRIPLALGWR